MILDLIKERRSIRKYLDINISKEDINYILEAGRYAPSGGNEQPWRFGIIDDKNIIKEIVKACRNQKWIGNAPVIIALCTKRSKDEDLSVEMYRLGKLKDEIYNIDSNVIDILCAREHQTLIAAENIMLAARERNIGSCLVSYIDVYRASKVLNLPDDYLVTFIITLGYEEESKDNKDIKKLEDVVFYNHF